MVDKKSTATASVNLDFGGLFKEQDIVRVFLAFKVWMMSGDKQISCQTMEDRIGTRGSGEDAEAVQINQKKISKQFDFAQNFSASLGSACYSEEIFHFPGILKSTQNKGKYVNFQFGEKSNLILCAL